MGSKGGGAKTYKRVHRGRKGTLNTAVVSDTVMEGLSVQNVELEISENHKKHHTEEFSDSQGLVVRRGDPFRVTLQLRGRPFHPRADSLRIKVLLGRLYATMPVSFYNNEPPASNRWWAYMEPSTLDVASPSFYILPPPTAAVGIYRFHLQAYTQGKKTSRASGGFTLLFNPWCREDSVYIPFEDQREEYIQNDSCLLFMGTSMNVISRPWSYDQFEPGVLDACLDLLQYSPQHKQNAKEDYLKRNNPVYVGRVVSAMINSEDDRGVLKGNWSGNFKDGVNPSRWTGSGEIMTQWARSGYKAVKYGQCWVFAAVMCTVMRALGIPCRVVTNFNSAHDTNDNLVIEEYYSENGQKLNLSKDSIWNFHVWVECWMTRPDLTSDMDGWQVLDPTPQERSGGVFCCGPAPVKAVKDRRIDLVYDIPFVYAEVNADVHTIILSNRRMVSSTKDSERVGSLICTKAVGFPRLQNITGDYKYIKSPTSTLTSRSSSPSDDSSLRRGSYKGLSVLLVLDKTPVTGAPIRFTIKAVNRDTIPKMVRVHLNAQTKEYNYSPSDTFWETQGTVQLAPMDVQLLRLQILPSQYEEVVGDDLINLAVVLEDMVSQERVLASEEFNIASPELLVEIMHEESIVQYKQQVAMVTFINPYSYPVSGILTVAGAGLLQEKAHFRMHPLAPGRRVQQRISFVPTKVGMKMLQASLSLSNRNSTIRGYKMVQVN